jgi:uncharacterized protein YbjT (DUF2867 family)
VDAVFMQITATARRDQLPPLARAGAEAVRAVGVERVVMTTSSVVPPAPTGVAAPDARVAMLEAVRDIPPGAIVLRPTLLLDNFSGPPPPALDGGVIPQGITAEVPVAYLSADDQAAFAVAALDRPALAEPLLPIAGPDAVTGPALAAVLSAAVGRALRYVPMDEAQTRDALAFAGEDAVRAVSQMYAREGTRRCWSARPGHPEDA